MLGDVAIEFGKARVEIMQMLAQHLHATLHECWQTLLVGQHRRQGALEQRH